MATQPSRASDFLTPWSRKVMRHIDNDKTIQDIVRDTKRAKACWVGPFNMWTIDERAHVYMESLSVDELETLNDVRTEAVEIYALKQFVLVLLSTKSSPPDMFGIFTLLFAKNKTIIDGEFALPCILSRQELSTFTVNRWLDVLAVQRRHKQLLATIQLLVKDIYTACSNCALSDYAHDHLSYTRRIKDEATLLAGFNQFFICMNSRFDESLSTQPSQVDASDDTLLDLYEELVKLLSMYACYGFLYRIELTNFTDKLKASDPLLLHAFRFLLYNDTAAFINPFLPLLKINRKIVRACAKTTSIDSKSSNPIVPGVQSNNPSNLDPASIELALHHELEKKCRLKQTCKTTQVDTLISQTPRKSVHSNDKHLPSTDTSGYKPSTEDVKREVDRLQAKERQIEWFDTHNPVKTSNKTGSSTTIECDVQTMKLYMPPAKPTLDFGSYLS